MVHEPAQSAFDDPPAWRDGEAAAAWDAADDFEGDAEAGGVVDEVLAVAAVGPALADGRVIGCARSRRVWPAVES